MSTPSYLHLENLIVLFLSLRPVHKFVRTVGEVASCSMHLKAFIFAISVSEPVTVFDTMSTHHICILKAQKFLLDAASVRTLSLSAFVRPEAAVAVCTVQTFLFATSVSVFT